MKAISRFYQESAKILVDTNNDIYVLGIGMSPGGQVSRVKKISASGSTVWDYFDSGIGAPFNFKFTPGNHILTGNC